MTESSVGDVKELISLVTETPSHRNVLSRSDSDPLSSLPILPTSIDVPRVYQHRELNDDSGSRPRAVSEQITNSARPVPLQVQRSRVARSSRGYPEMPHTISDQLGPTVSLRPERFLASQGSPYLSGLMSAVQSTDDGLQQKNMVLSRRLPSWIWYLLAKSLGIKLYPEDKPWFATLLHTLTLTSAVLLAITGAWYTICDIMSEYSKTTVMIGTVTMMIGFAWILLGVYAHKLAGKLFSNKNFAESVRMHSKTFLKVSTAGLLTIIGFMLVGVNAYDGFDDYWNEECSKIGISLIICYILFVSKTVYAFICVVWTLLVGYVLMSVCRTHTIGIRRFMREMIMDAKRYESYWLQNILGQSQMDGVLQEGVEEEEWFLWDDQVIYNDNDNQIVTSQNVFLESIGGVTYIPDRSQKRNRMMSTKSETISEHEVELENAALNEGRQPAEGGVSANYTKVLPIMSNNDLLFSYWKVSRRLVMTSRFLQRWLSSWIAFIFIWCADYIVYWATHKATLSDIVQFVFPLLTLLIVCSAYAEVNSEGQRLLKCVCPTEGRLRIIEYLNQQPLQMQVFSFAITYNAVLGVILAFSVAFASRIVLDEVITP